VICKKYYNAQNVLEKNLHKKTLKNSSMELNFLRTQIKAKNRQKQLPSLKENYQLF
jgi:hypothetical protein